MNQWALLQGGRIVNVCTTNMTRAEIQAKHPEYDVRDLWSLPANVQEQYQYWNERP